MLHLCQFWFSKLLIELLYIWHINFSWNKAVGVDSTAPTNGTRSEEACEPLKGNRRTKVGTTKDIFMKEHYTYEGHTLTLFRQTAKYVTPPWGPKN